MVLKEVLKVVLKVVLKLVLKVVLKVVLKQVLKVVLKELLNQVLKVVLMSLQSFKVQTSHRSYRELFIGTCDKECRERRRVTVKTTIGCNNRILAHCLN